MATVDPFVIQWPKRWLDDREIEPVIRYLNRFLHDLWQRSGGPVDSVSNSVYESIYFSKEAAPLIAKRKIVETSSNYTTAGNEIVVVNSEVTITLNNLPRIEEQPIIINNAGTVTISGNGKNIIGDSSYVSLAQYETIRPVYAVGSDEWFIT